MRCCRAKDGCRVLQTLGWPSSHRLAVLAVGSVKLSWVNAGSKVWAQWVWTLPEVRRPETLPLSEIEKGCEVVKLLSQLFASNARVPSMPILEYCLSSPMFSPYRLDLLIANEPTTGTDWLRCTTIGSSRLVWIRSWDGDIVSSDVNPRGL